MKLKTKYMYVQIKDRFIVLTKIVGLLIVITLAGCQEKYVIVPAFEIKVDLDEKAERELKSRKETLIVSVEMSGTPRKDAWVNVNKASGLVLGFFQKEMVSERSVSFDGLKIPENLYQALENKDYGVSVGVRSGWKSSEINLLSCEPFGGGISNIAGKQHVVKCILNREQQENYVSVPSFDIKIDLSDKAEKELKLRNETIKISLWLSGIPRKDAGIKEIDKALGLVLGFFEKELNEERVVRFEDLRVPKNLYDALENKEYSVSISVTTGWKSSKFNLLNCEPFGKHISKIAGNRNAIKCKLIKEDE